MDISTLCRSCMKEVALWEREEFDERSIEMFSYCTSIEIKPSDKLPKRFCYDCKIKIESTYTFIKEAQRVNQEFTNITSINHFTDSIKLEPKNDLSDLELQNTKYNSDNDSEGNQVLDENINNCNRNGEDNFINDTKEIVTTDLSKQKCIKAENLTTNVLPEQKQSQCTMTRLKIGKKNKRQKLLCNECNKVFYNKTELTRHLDRQHSEKSNTCQYCYIPFRLQTGLTKHLLTKHSEQYSKRKTSEKGTNSVGKFICNTCGAVSIRKSHLIAHLLTHSDERPYRCTQCDKRFKTKYAVANHEEVHVNRKTHLCSVCGQAFNQVSNMRIHMRRHTGHQPFRCGECPFRSAFHSSFKRHVDRHRGTPRHHCGVCGKRFYDQTGLIRHTRIHTGELPYKCPQCPRAFLDAWKRKSHLVHQHKLVFGDIPPMPKDPAKDNGLDE